MSNWEKAIWVIACFLIIPIGFLMLRVFNQLKNDNDQPEDQEIKQQLTEAKKVIQDLNDQRVAEGQASHQAEIDNIKKFQLDFQRNITNDLRNLNQALKQEIATQITQESKNINDSVNQVNRLFKTSTKHTGQLGEALLRRMLINIQAIGSKNKFLIIEEQTELVNKRRPDLVIKSPKPHVPPIYIDAKFPVNSYEVLINDPQNEDLRKNLIKAIKQEVKTLNEKYVTADFDIEQASDQASFVIMFLPSDGIYYELINADKGFGKNEKVTSSNEDMTFIEFCFNEFVVPTSPSTIIGLLSTIERYGALFTQLKVNDEQIKTINRISKKYGDLVTEINGIIKIYNNLGSKLEQLKKPFNLIEKITNKYPNFLDEITPSSPLITSS